MFGNNKKYSSQYERMTTEPIPNLIVEMGIPTTLSMLVTNIYNMADTAFVGQLGTSASGAVGVVFGFMAIIQAFGFMYGQGAGSIISRSLGKKEGARATKIATTAFVMALITGLMLSGIGRVFIDKLVYMLGSTDTIFPYAKSYISCILMASPLMMCTFTMNNILRFEGKASLAMVGLMTGAIINIGLDPVLIFVFDLGVLGAGMATAISQCISFCILLFMFLSGRTQSKLSLRSISTNPRDIMDICATGFPSLIRQGLQSISTMLLNQQARIYGDAVVAAMGIVSRLAFFIFAVGLGIGQGFQPVSGFNYGAGKFSRVREAFRFTLILGEVCLGTAAIIGLLFSNQLIAIFRNDPAVIAFGTPALRYQCYALFLNPLVVLSNMTFQSTGQKATAAFLSMLRSGLYFIPILLLLVHSFGPLGIQLAQPITDVLAFITATPIIANFLRKLPADVS